MRRALTLSLRAAVLLAGVAVPAAAGTIKSPAVTLGRLDRMMAELAPESAQSGATIKRLYQNHLDLLMLREYTELAGALDNGGLVPLPTDPRFNVVPRLDGPHPIGEKDLKNQSSYIAARPATMGALLEIASQVKSGPIEVTSLVRHEEYQESLRSTNPNATTSVPMHTMGLAFDIALVNTPLATVNELRRVLQKMQDRGDILFIGERKQLVFHVVPHPSRLGHFNDVYLKAVGTQSTGRFAEVVGTMPGQPAAHLAQIQPRVTIEVVAMLPAEGPVVNVWTETPPAPVEKRSVAQASVGLPMVSSEWRRLATPRWLTLLAALSIASWWLVGRRQAAAIEFLRN